MNIQEKIKKITSSWFYSEPILFSVFCTHQLIENNESKVPFRTGHMHIEYSSKLIEDWEDSKIEAGLKVECYRILLGHPYARQPYNAKKGVMVIASDALINQYCYKNEINDYTNELPGVMYLKNQAVRFHTLTHPLGIKWSGTEEVKFFQRNLQIEPKTGILHSVDDLTYEQWYSKILFLIKQSSIAGDNAGASEVENEALQDSAELWQEDNQATEQIKNEIEKAHNEQGWGGLGGELVRAIEDNCDFSFDYRRALTQFRQSIVSPLRSLTRMRPSRRYSFQAMGSRYERKANILIAVDVSGSITDESFEHFYHAINNFFFLGLIEKIDLIFFDVNLKNTKPISFRKKIKLENIKGRGGTNFQPAIDFYEENKNNYSGMIIFTDGQGNIPKINVNKTNILWILEGRIAYEQSYKWINQLSGCKATYLPF